MNWMEQYYSRHSDSTGKKSKPEKAKEIVFSIMEDFLDRRNLKQAFGEIDEDIKEEIIESWYLKTLNSLNEKS